MEKCIKTVETPICPNCGSSKVLELMYGYPTRELEEAAGRGEVELGGCCVGEDSPRWSCQECNHQWGKTAFGFR